MRKGILFLMFVLSFIGNAQISVTEGFEAATLPTGWTIGTDPTNTNVGLSTNVPITGSRSFVFNFGAYGNGSLYTSNYTSNGAAIQVSFKSKDSHNFQHVDYRLYYQISGAAAVQVTGTGPRAANTAVVTNSFSIAAGAVPSGSQVKFIITCIRIGSSGPIMFVDDFIIDQTGGSTDPVVPITFSNLTSSAITNTTATVSVTLPNVCVGANYNLQYSKNSNFSVPTLNVNNLPAGAAGVKNHNLTGLESGTTYYFRFYASPNQACNTSEIISSVQNFTTTGGAAPTITSISATNITSTSATINYSLNANGGATTSQILYGPGLTSSLTGFSATGTTTTPGTVQYTGLQPNTLYNYKVQATNSAGTSTSALMGFTTAATASSIAFSNLTSSAITNTTATVSVTLANVCAGATYRMQYSTTSVFTTANNNVFVDNLISTNVANGINNINVTNLLPNKQYFFRFYGSGNQACNPSSIYSSTANFTTTSASSVSAPTAASPQYICPYQTNSVLTATGTGLKWYEQATGGTEMSNGTILGTLTYYVSQTIDGNESPRTAVAAILNPTPAKPSAQTQTFCAGSGATFADIVTTGTNVRWYTSFQPQFGVEIPSTTAISAYGLYYFTQTVGGCESARANVQIFYNTVVGPFFEAISPICLGDVITSLPTTSINGVTGTWSPAFDNLVTTTYTFTPTPGLCATSTTMTVTVGGTKTWSGSPASWSPSAPTNADVAIISADYNASTALNACSLLVDNNAVVNIPAGTQISLKNEITVSPGSSFTMNSNAVLLQKFAVANSGNISFLRESAPLYRQDYTMWSSPVVGQNLRSFSPQTLFNRFYSYNEVTNSYDQELFNAADIATKNFASGLGYLIRMPNNWPMYVGPGIGGTHFTGSFTGVPANGDITVPLSITGQKYNLIGNPYPSPINIGTFFVDNPNLAQNLYFWRKRNGASGSGFAIWSSMGLVSTQPGYSTITDIFNRISSGQGFFVRSNTATSVNFNNNQRENYQGYFFKGNTTDEDANDRSRIWLNLIKDQEQVGQMLLGYTSAATNEVDDFDAPYFNDSALALTSLISTEEYSIQSRTSFTSADIVSLGFKTDLAGDFSIALSNFDGLFEGNQVIILKDNLTGIHTDLKTADYNFSAVSGVFNERFELRFDAALANNEIVGTANYINISTKNDVINIVSSSTVEKVEVYDLSGRMLFEKKDLNNTAFAIDNLNVAQQVLLVKVTTNEGKMVTKKIIF